MTWKIKNLKLALLALVLFCVFISLGMWQLRRADEKLLLLKSYSQRAHDKPLQADKLLDQEDLRFYRAQLHGTFDNEHTILLDNKTQHGKIGYEVYTPFKADGLNMPILVDRGFVQTHGLRSELPNIHAVTDETAIVGLLNAPPPATRHWARWWTTNRRGHCEWNTLICTKLANKCTLFFILIY